MKGMNQFNSGDFSVICKKGKILLILYLKGLATRSSTSASLFLFEVVQRGFRRCDNVCQQILS